MALLARKPSPMSPERTALADAIAAHNDFLARRSDLAAAADEADRAVTTARRAVTVAEDAVADAPEAFDRYLRARAAGEALSPPPTLREAREALADAQFVATSAEAACASIKAELGIPADQSRTKSRLRDAVRAVLRSEGHTAACAVAAELARLQQEMVRHGQLLDLLIENEAFPVEERIGPNHGRPADPSIREAQALLDSERPTMWQLWREQDGAAEFRTALAALETDATVPLPGGAS